MKNTSTIAILLLSCLNLLAAVETNPAAVDTFVEDKDRLSASAPVLVNMTNYPIATVIQPYYWFLASDISDSTNVNVPYPLLLRQLQSDLLPSSGTVTQNFTGTISANAFSGDGSQLFNLPSIGSALNTKSLNLLTVGDSLTQERGTGTDVNFVNHGYDTYPRHLRALWTNVIGSFYSQAVGGVDLDWVTNGYSSLLNHVNQSASNSIMILWIGANNPSTTGSTNFATPSSWLDTYYNYCSNIQSAGIKLVVVTIQDRLGFSASTNWQYWRTNLNAGIRASHFYDYLTDMDARNPTMDTNNPNVWWTYDGTHANTNGAIWQAKIIDQSVSISIGGGAYLGWFSSLSTVPPQLDSDYRAFITRANITNTTEKSALQTLVASAKKHGWWALCDAIYPFVGSTSNSCAQNLVSSSYTIAWKGSVTFALNGVTGDGATGYGDTGFNPYQQVSAAFQYTDSHLFCYSGASPSSPVQFFTCLGAGTGAGLSPASFLVFYGTGSACSPQVRLNTTVGDGVGPTFYAGPLIATRTNSATGGYGSYFLDKSGHDSGLASYGPLNASVAGTLVNTNLAVLGCLSTAGYATNFFSGPLMGASFGGGMVPFVWELCWRDWQNFESALGRNP